MTAATRCSPGSATTGPNGGARPGGFLSAVQTLSDAGQSALFPQVAVDADGDAVFTWRRDDGSGNFCCFRAQARARSAAGTLSAVQTLPTGGRDAFDPHVAVDPDGD